MRKEILRMERVTYKEADMIELEDFNLQIYEGEIYYNWIEYEFEIDASTGNFIEWSVDYKD